MKIIHRLIKHIRLTGGLIALLVMAASLLVPVSVSAQTISDDCAECHNAIYQDWKASGHPYKLMEGAKAQNRPIPLPEGYSWDDISYVIGGYKWKSRYMDENGYIITQGRGDVPGDTQYNYMVGAWVDYHADELDGTKPYDCGSCHTTGWVADDDADTDGDLSDNQDQLPGIHGTFLQGGIQCIQCHGGAQHADFGMVDDSAEACGACHYRTAAPGDVNVIPASGGFIKHHEQYNEFLASGAHGNFMECTTCHDPHKRGEFSIKEGAFCEDCHTDIAASYAETTMYDYQVSCNDCHMPLATKSGQVTGPHQGDVMTHIFRIETDPMADMFTEDGAFVALDENGDAAVTLDFACQRCHETASLEELAKFAVDFHENDGSLENIGLNPGLSGTWFNPAAAGEGFLVEFAYAGPVLYFFGSFYTYDDSGNLVWLTFEPASGVPDSGTSVDVVAYITDGGSFGAGNPGNPPARFGSGTFTFGTCTTGSVSIMPDQAFLDAGFTNLAYDLTRLLEPGVKCPTFDNNSGMSVAAD